MRWSLIKILIFVGSAAAYFGIGLRLHVNHLCVQLQCTIDGGFPGTCSGGGPPTTPDYTGGTDQWSGPSLHDLDDDGDPEIIYGAAVYRSDGCLVSSSLGYPAYHKGYIPVIADVDADGRVWLATRRGVSCSPGRSGSSPTASRIVRTAFSMASRIGTFILYCRSRARRRRKAPIFSAPACCSSRARC